MFFSQDPYVSYALIWAIIYTIPIILTSNILYLSVCCCNNCKRNPMISPMWLVKACCKSLRLCGGKFWNATTSSTNLSKMKSTSSVCESCEERTKLKTIDIFFSGMLHCGCLKWGLKLQFLLRSYKRRFLAACTSRDSATLLWSVWLGKRLNLFMGIEDVLEGNKHVQILCIAQQKQEASHQRTRNDMKFVIK